MTSVVSILLDSSLNSRFIPARSERTRLEMSWVLNLFSQRSLQLAALPELVKMKFVSMKVTISEYLQNMLLALMFMK
jgi:hypothetical protein